MSTRRLNRVTGCQGEIIIFIKALIKSFKACVVEVIYFKRLYMNTYIKVENKWIIL